MASLGWLALAVTMTIEGEKTVGYELVAAPIRRRQVNLAVVMISFFAPQPRFGDDPHD